MYKYSKVIAYYFLLLVGLFIVSWMIWARFIRERTIRDIPDSSFTELRFWILIYICFIYAYSIKHLVKSASPNEIVSNIVNILYTPLTTLDRFLKYNSYTKNHYNSMIPTIMESLSRASNNKIIAIIFMLQILPRIFLVIFLVLDTFWFHKLEIMYKIILLALLPLIFRYLSYSLKDVYNYWVEELDLHYSFVYVFQEDYEYDFKYDAEFIPEHHYKQKPIKEYIEIKYQNWKDYHCDNVNYEYVGDAYSRQTMYDKHRIEKYMNSNATLNTKDYEELRNLFEELMPKIINLKYTLEHIEHQKDKAIIRWPKIVIFSLYLLCWGVILVVSEYYYPVEFHMAKAFLYNFIRYLLNINNDPFSMLQEHSSIKNLITIENVTRLIKQVIAVILKNTIG